MKGLQALLTLWTSALAETYGRRVHTSDRRLLMNRLYAARREAKDEDLAGLSIVMPANRPNELWIVKREPGNAPPSE